MRVKGKLTGSPPPKIPKDKQDAFEALINLNLDWGYEVPPDHFEKRCKTCLINYKAWYKTIAKKGSNNADSPKQETSS